MRIKIIDRSLTMTNRLTCSVILLPQWVIRINSLTPLTTTTIIIIINIGEEVPKGQLELSKQKWWNIHPHQLIYDQIMMLLAIIKRYQR